jgi:hypothetical protein
LLVHALPSLHILKRTFPGEPVLAEGCPEY